LHREAFAHSTVLLREAFTHRENFYTENLSHRELLHREAFTQRTFSFCTETLLHREAFTQRIYYTEKLLHREALTYTMQAEIAAPKPDLGAKAKQKDDFGALVTNTHTYIYI